MNTHTSIVDAVLSKKLAFLVAFFLIFTTTYGVLTVLDWLPEPVTTTKENKETDNLSAEANDNGTNYVDQNDATEEILTTADTLPVLGLAADALPQILRIEALDREVTVLNPATRDIASLDAALLKGVVRHPDSATLAQDGNLFILGHSSYLPKVLNRNFQALNGIQNLKWGDTLTLSSSDMEYTYRVEKVYQAKASAITVPIAGTGKRLTLATCNSFGSTDDRYIVEASLLSQKAL